MKNAASGIKFSHATDGKETREIKLKTSSKNKKYQPGYAAAVPKKIYISYEFTDVVKKKYPEYSKHKNKHVSTTTPTTTTAKKRVFYKKKYAFDTPHNQHEN